MPPADFLPTLRDRCDDAGALLVIDAIFTGIGRLGEMWPAAEIADILCVGKALGGGLPLSAALFVTENLAALWAVDGEDLYTHTHVGNPLACAAALVVLEEVPKLLPRVRELAERFEVAGWQGAGLLRTRPQDAARATGNGVLVIPVPAREGRQALVQAAPAYTIGDEELEEAFARLGA